MTSGCKMRGIKAKLMTSFLSGACATRLCWAGEAEGRADARRQVIATDYLLGMLKQSLQRFARKKRSDLIYGGLRMGLNLKNLFGCFGIDHRL